MDNAVVEAVVEFENSYRELAKKTPKWLNQLVAMKNRRIEEAESKTLVLPFMPFEGVIINNMDILALGWEGTLEIKWWVSSETLVKRELISSIVIPKFRVYGMYGKKQTLSGFFCYPSIGAHITSNKYTYGRRYGCVCTGNYQPAGVGRGLCIEGCGVVAEMLRVINTKSIGRAQGWNDQLYRGPDREAYGKASKRLSKVIDWSRCPENDGIEDVMVDI